jgi:5'-nucleotidase
MVVDKMIILVDQDDTLADFDGRFLELWRARYPAAPFVSPDQRRNFYLRDDYPAEHSDRLSEIYAAPGFFRNLPPIAGGLEAVQQMLALGHDVRICTAPLDQYEHCVLEKFQWIEQHLGHEFVRRIVLTYDKTLVRGRILIDDRPDIRGAVEPEWEHVLFDQPFNRQVAGKRRLNWSNWRAVLGL